MQFLQHFDTNLHRIGEAIRLYSGAHAIDPARAAEFVSRQHTPIRRRAAQDLIDHTVYITLNNVRDSVDKLVVRLNDEHGLFSNRRNNSGPVYMYVGNPAKSFYFISVLALDAIRKRGLKEPLPVHTLTPEMFDSAHPIVLFDDISYSGTQMSNMFYRIYYDTVIIRKQPAPNLFAALVAANTVSLEKLTKVPLKRASKTFYSFIPSPFRVLYDRRCPTLVESLEPERWVALVAFFTGLLISPPVSIYTDHKMADDVSTFKTALTYGPVVPMSYGRDANFRESVLMKIIDHLGLGVDEADRLLNTIAEKDVSDRELDASTIQIQFIPFIHGCEHAVRTTITTMGSIPYPIFIYGDSVRLDYFDRDDAPHIEHIRDNMVQCPESWYKRGALEMQ